MAKPGLWTGRQDGVAWTVDLSAGWLCLDCGPVVEWVPGPWAFWNAALAAWRATIYEDER